MKDKDQVKTEIVKDLSGQIFGYLTVISQTEERIRRSVVWECECKCGKRKRVPSTYLLRGSTKSCGCDQKKSSHSMKDLSGQKFDQLTAISPTKERNSSGAVVWKCSCSCGGQKNVSSRELLSGNVRHCGCNQKRAKDLSGQKFGRLTAISPTNERINRCVVWECECECGERKNVSSNLLKQGKVKSCGCYQNERVKDISGQKFGRLTAVSLANERGTNYSAIWECECECGGRKNVASRFLTSGHVKSCGCMHQEKKRDLRGQTFGRLTVIAPTEEKINESTVWECDCSCGNKKKAVQTNLIEGKTKSCGCLQLESSTEMMKNIADNYRVEGTNLASITKKPRSKSGVKGVYWRERSKKWEASIRFQGKAINLGSFAKLEDAAAARKAAEEKYFKPVLEKYQDRLTSRQIARLDDDV